MPFINQAAQDEITEQYDRYEHIPESSFGDVFQASLGLVVDEELSISSLLNKEGWDQRRQLIDERAESGAIPDMDRYRTRSPRAHGGAISQIDYDRIARDLDDPAIKTDAQLHEERNEILAQRREYAQDVIERGSGMAQFLGALNGYVLDPINLATVGIGSGITAARGVSTVGRAALTARNTAIVEGAAELGIQTLVFQHKQDIDSPYSAGDALANIGMAATGAAALGGVAGGLSGWLEGVLKVADDVPQTDEVVAAKEYLNRTRNNLKQAPRASTEKPNQSEISPDAEPYHRFTRGAPSTGVGHMMFSDDVERVRHYGDVHHTFNPKDLPEESIVDAGDPEFHRQLQESLEDRPEVLEPFQARAESLADEANPSDIVDSAGFWDAPELVEIAWEDVLMPNDWRAVRTSDGVIVFDESVVRTHRGAEEAQIESDIEFLREMNNRAELYDKPAKTAETYQSRVDDEPIKKPAASASQRERDVLIRQGIADEYDQALAEFRELDNPILRIDDEDLDPQALIDQYDEEIKGLDDVLRCVYG